LFPLHKGLQILPLRIGEISHALCLQQLHGKSNRLFTSDLGEIGSRMSSYREAALGGAHSISPGLRRGCCVSE
jgi:hypothetical protein